MTGKLARPSQRIAGDVGRVEYGAKTGCVGRVQRAEKSMAFWLLKYEPLLKKRRSVERTSCCTVYRKQLLGDLCLPGFVVGDGLCV